MAENQNAYNAPAEAPADESASSIDFEPVPVRHRIDGWTPEKQRDYLEALADTGVAGYAAALVGMTEQSATRLRRRPDARSFDRACTIAMRHGARRLVSIAFERVIEGTIKRHYYHGELVSEERVYDNRLLIALLGKLGPLLETEESRPAADEWQPWMEAVEQGLPEPPPPPSSLEPVDFDEIWEEDGVWWTYFPPPPGFEGRQEGVPATYNYYRRELSKAELAVLDARVVEEDEQMLAEQTERRDHFFGFKPKPSADGAAGAQPVRETKDFSPKGSEPYEPFDQSGGEHGRRWAG